MAEYKSNSHKNRNLPEEKRANKIVSGKVTSKKRSELGNLSRSFISDEAKNIKSYLIMDVVIPTIKDTIWTAFTNSLDMILYGGAGNHRNNGRNRNSSRFSYSSQYVSRDNFRDRFGNRSQNNGIRSALNIGEFIFESRTEAEAVLDEMFNILDQYTIVRVGDLYDMIGQSQPYTSNKYGWTKLDTATINRTRQGWILDLPNPLPID